MPRKHRPLPPLALVQQHYSCDAAAGTLTRLKQCQGSKAPGTVIKGAERYYRRVYLQGKAYLLSRIIWLMVTGEDPGDMQVDHIDGDISNNAISNLRIVTQGQNNINKRSWAASGYKGVYVRHLPSGVRYYVQVHRTAGKLPDGRYIRKTTSHGAYDTAEEAAAVYQQVIKLQYSDAVPYTREDAQRSEALRTLQNNWEVISSVNATTMHDARAALSGLTAPERMTVEVALMVLGIEVADSSRGALADALWQMARAHPDEDFSIDDDDYCDDMDGDHGTALESAGWGDEPMGYEAGEWI